MARTAISGEIAAVRGGVNLVMSVATHVQDAAYLSGRFSEGLANAITVSTVSMVAVCDGREIERLAIA